MPAGNWFVVPLAREQLLTSRHLGVSAIANLEPCAGLAVGDIRCRFQLGDDAFEIQLAYSLKVSPSARDRTARLPADASAAVLRILLFPYPPRRSAARSGDNRSL